MSNNTEYNQYLKPNIFLPIIIGVLIGLILFIMGGLEDAPGLCLIGLVIGTGLIFFSLLKIEKLRQKIDLGIAIPLFYCIGGIFLAVVLGIDNEITQFQAVMIITIMICTGLISITAIMMIRKLHSKSSVR